MKLNESPKTCWFRIVALSIAISLPFNELAVYADYSAVQTLQTQLTPHPFDVSRMYIPKKLGIIQETFKGKSDRLIIHIQDAHGHLAAQERLAGLVKYFHENYGVDLVSVEGAAGELPLADARNFPDRKIRREVSRRFLESSRLTGDEYYVISENPALTMYGAERMFKYYVNRDQFFKARARGENLKSILKRFRLTIHNLEDEVYGKDLRTLMHDVRRTEDQMHLFLRHVRFLRNLYFKRVRNDALFFEQSFPTINLLLENKLEGDQAAVAQEFLSEMTKLRVEAGEALIHTDEEKRLFGLSTLFDLLERLVDLKLTSSDYKELLIHKKDLNADHFRYVLNSLSKKSCWRDEYAEVFDSLPIFLRFYKGAHARDKVLAENTEKIMQKKHENIVLAITGGFHTRGMTRLWQAKDISYVVVQPTWEAVEDNGKTNSYQLSAAKSARETLSISQIALRERIGGFSTPWRTDDYRALLSAMHEASSQHQRVTFENMRQVVDRETFPTAAKESIAGFGGAASLDAGEGEGKELSVQTEVVRAFLDDLKKAGLNDIVVVGGAVRDGILGRQPRDIDIQAKVYLSFSEWLLISVLKAIDQLPVAWAGYLYTQGMHHVLKKLALKKRAIWERLQRSEILDNVEGLFERKATYRGLKVDIVSSVLVTDRGELLTFRKGYSIELLAMDPHGTLYTLDALTTEDFKEKRVRLVGPGALTIGNILRGIWYRYSYEGFSYERNTWEAMQKFADWLSGINVYAHYILRSKRTKRNNFINMDRFIERLGDRAGEALDDLGRLGILSLLIKADPQIRELVQPYRGEAETDLIASALDQAVESAAAADAQKKAEVTPDEEDWGLPESALAWQIRAGRKLIELYKSKPPSATIFIEPLEDYEDYAKRQAKKRFYNILNSNEEEVGNFSLEIEKDHIRLVDVQISAKQIGYGETIARWALGEAIKRFPESKFPLVLYNVNNLAILHFAEILFERDSIEIFEPSNLGWQSLDAVEFDKEFLVSDPENPDTVFSETLHLKGHFKGKGRFVALRIPEGLVVRRTGLKITVAEKITFPTGKEKFLEAKVKGPAFSLRGLPRPDAAISGYGFGAEGPVLEETGLLDRLDKAREKILVAFPHLQEISFWRHPLQHFRVTSLLTWLSLRLVELDHMFRQSLVNHTDQERLGKQILDLELKLGLRDDSKRFRVGAGSENVEAEPFMGTITPYKYLEPASVHPQSLEEGLTNIEKKVREIIARGHLPVVRVVGEHKSGVSTLVERITSAESFAGIPSERIDIVDDKILWAYGMPRDKISKDLPAAYSSRKDSTGLIVVDSGWLLDQVLFDDVPVEIETVDVYVEADEEERWQRIVEAQKENPMEGIRTIMELATYYTHGALARYWNQGYEKSRADVVVYSDRLLEKIASGEAEPTPIVPRPEKGGVTAGFGSAGSGTGRGQAALFWFDDEGGWPSGEPLIQTDVQALREEGFSPAEAKVLAPKLASASALKDAFVRLDPPEKRALLDFQRKNKIQKPDGSWIEIPLPVRIVADKGEFKMKEAAIVTAHEIVLKADLLRAPPEILTTILLHGLRRSVHRFEPERQPHDAELFHRTLQTLLSPENADLRNVWLLWEESETLNSIFGRDWARPLRHAHQIIGLHAAWKNLFKKEIRELYGWASVRKKIDGSESWLTAFLKKNNLRTPNHVWRESVRAADGRAIVNLYFSYNLGEGLEKVVRISAAGAPDWISSPDASDSVIAGDVRLDILWDVQKVAEELVGERKFIEKFSHARLSRTIKQKGLLGLVDLLNFGSSEEKAQAIRRMKLMLKSQKIDPKARAFLADLIHSSSYTQSEYDSRIDLNRFNFDYRTGRPMDFPPSTFDYSAFDSEEFTVRVPVPLRKNREVRVAWAGFGARKLFEEENLRQGQVLFVEGREHLERIVQAAEAKGFGEIISPDWQVVLLDDEGGTDLEKAREARDAILRSVKGLSPVRVWYGKALTRELEDVLQSAMVVFYGDENRAGAFNINVVENNLPWQDTLDWLAMSREFQQAA